MAKQKKTKKLFFREHKIKIILTALFICAVFLRSYNLYNSLFFGPEQGIDFFRIKSIVVDHHPVLVGAKTDIAGVFHGPIYYYLAAIPFLASRGDPFIIALFFILLNCITIFPLYSVCKKLFSVRAGLISAALFTISFGAITYTHWLSSHPLVIPLTAFFLLGIVNFLTGNKKYLILSSVSLALLGQAEFLNYLLFGGILTLIICFSFKEFKKTSPLLLLLNAGIIFVLGFTHYIIFDYKNQFIMSKSLLGLFQGKGYYISYLSVFSQINSQFTQSIGKVFLPFLPSILSLIALLTILVLLYKNKNTNAKKVLFPTLFIPLILLLILRHAVLEQFFVYSIIPAIILFGFLLDTVLRKKLIIGAIFISIVFSCNLYVWFMYAPQNNFMFFSSTQPDLHLRDEKKVIDKIYKAERGKNFSFQSYTIPYWTQDAWEYLFWQYGKSKYGYMPVSENGKTLYVIIQDDPSSESFQQNWLKNTVSKWGEETGSFRQGIFTVKILKVSWVK